MKGKGEEKKKRKLGAGWGMNMRTAGIGEGGYIDCGRKGHECGPTPENQITSPGPEIKNL